MFGKSIRLVRLFGFEVNVDASWLVLAALVTWSLGRGTFRFYYPALPEAAYWAMAVAGALALFASILAHEFAHSLVARRAGLPAGSITLFIFGGVSNLEEEPRTPGVELATAIVGPLASLVLALVLWGVFALGTSSGWGLPVLGVLAYLRTVNLALAAFNLIPAFPLDGGRVLRAALWKWGGSLRRATRVAAGIGQGFGILLAGFGVLEVFLTTSLLTPLWWVLIGLFISSAARQSWQAVAVRETLRGEPVRHLMATDVVAVAPDTTVERLVDEYVYRHRFTRLPVVENGLFRGCVSTEQVKEIPREEWSRRTVGELLRPCADWTIGGDADAAEALARMQRLQVSRLMVVEDGRLAGTVSMRDMVRFSALKRELEPGNRAGGGNRDGGRNRAA